MTSELRGPIKGHLEDTWSGERLERVRRRVAASRRMPRQRARRWTAVVAASATIIAIGSLGWWQLRSPEPARPGPIALPSGVPFAHAAGPAEIALSDGSRLALDSGELRVLESDGHHVLLTQGDGRVTYDIRPGGPRRWSIDAGVLSVDVLGTRFTVDRRGERASVEVTRGRVRVRTARTQRVLGAGESISVGEEPVQASVSEPAAITPEPAIEIADNTPSPRPARRVAAPEPQPDWRALAAEGRHADAFALLGEDGFRAQTAQVGSVEDLFGLADTARLSGHPALARAPLARITSEFASDRRAGVAALTLGRLELDALNAPADAVQSLETAERLGVSSRLQETLLARLAEAYARAGQSEPARLTAQRYLQAHPTGLHAGAMRALLSP